MLVELSALIEAKKFFSSNSAFSNDIEDANQQKRYVDSFINTNSVSGEAWDAVKSNLNNFSLALEKRTSVAQNMTYTIIGVLDRLINFLQTDDGNGIYKSLDLSRIDEIEKEIEKMKNSIDKLAKYMTSLDKTDENGRSKVQANIIKTEIIKSQFEKYLNKMKKFKVKYEEEMGNIQGLDGELSNFKSSVENLNPGNSLT